MTTLINIEIEENTDYSMQMTYEDPSTGLPVDITGYGAELLVEYGPGERGSLLSFNTTDGDIVLSGVSGNIVVTIPAASTLGLGQFQGYYNLFIAAGNGAGAKSKISKGFFTVTSSPNLVSF